MRAAGRQPRGGGGGPLPAPPRSGTGAGRGNSFPAAPGEVTAAEGDAKAAGAEGGRGERADKFLGGSRRRAHCPRSCRGFRGTPSPPLRCHPSAGSLLTKKFHRRLYRPDRGEPVGRACDRGGAGGGGGRNPRRNFWRAGPRRPPAPAGARSAGFVFAALAITLSLLAGGKAGKKGGGMPPPGSCSAGGRAPSPPPAQTEIRRQGGSACIYVCVYMPIGVEIALEMESGSTGGGL